MQIHRNLSCWSLSYFIDHHITFGRFTWFRVSYFTSMSCCLFAGDKDCVMLEKLSPHFQKISTAVVEPSSAQLNLFKARVEENCEALKGVTFDWKQQTSDEYLDDIEEGTTKTRKFHLITAIHVIYYTADLRNTLLKLHGLLEEGGVLFIIVGSGKIRIHLLLKVYQLSGNGRKGIQSYTHFPSYDMMNEYVILFHLKDNASWRCW